jgi:hypothetical protein
MNNTVSLVIGYSLAATLYGGYVVHLISRRRALVAELQVRTEDRMR